MKKITLSFFVAFITALGFAQISIDSIIVEQIDASSVMEEAITYRVFVDLEPGYQLMYYLGDEDCALTFLTTETWYNSEFGASCGYLINSEFIQLFPEIAFDSYLSLGGATSTEWGVLFDDDDSDGDVDGRMVINDTTIPALNSLGDLIGDELNNNFGNSPTQGSFIDDTSDSQFFTLTPHDEVTPNNRIMIGQFTTAGAFSFSLNLYTRLIGTNTTHLLSACEYPSLNFSVPVGIENLSANASDIILYPNPVQNQLLLDFNLKKSGQIKFEIFDVSGKLINSTASLLSSGEVTHFLNTETLENGIYLLRISNNETTITQKFSLLR